jgi:predicted Na+-dependent transporter
MSNYLYKWIEAHFSLMLFFGVAAGLFVPYLDLLPRYTPIMLVAGVMFFACSKVTASQMQGANYLQLAIFYILRFILLPILLYYAMLALLPQYALGALLVSLMPIGASAPAISNMTGGNTTLTLFATVFTNVFAPLSVPIIVVLCSGEQLQIDSFGLLMALASCIFCPAALYFAAYKIRPQIKPYVLRHSQFCVTILLSLMVASVVALRREYFFDNVAQSLIAFGIACLLYALLFGFGLIFACKQTLMLRKTYMICSGSNNIALSAAIAVLYFSSHTVIFTVVGEIAWVVAVSIYKKYALAFSNHTQS